MERVSYNASGTQLNLDIKATGLKGYSSYALCLNGKVDQSGNELLKRWKIVDGKDEGYYDFTIVDTDAGGTLAYKGTVDDLPAGQYLVTFVIKDVQENYNHILWQDLWKFTINRRTGGTVSQPTIKFTSVPLSGGGPTSRGDIAGTVVGLSNPEQYNVVLYAKTDLWYIQPRADDPFTPIDSDGNWENWTHLGVTYAVLIVRSSFGEPPAVLVSLPAVGGDIVAVAKTPAK